VYDPEKDMRRAWIVRLFYSFPSEPLLAAISSAAAILAVAATLIVPKMESHPWLLVFTICALAISFGFLCLVIGLLAYRTYLEFQRRTFDVSTIAPLLQEYEFSRNGNKMDVRRSKNLRDRPAT
jgi:hypothetical protein